MGRITDLFNQARGILNRRPPTGLTDAVASTRFDQMLYDEIKGEAPALRDLVDRVGEMTPTADDLVRDTVMQFFQSSPRLRGQGEMAPSHAVNHAVAEDISESPYLDQMRHHTVRSKYGATMAAIGATEQVEEYVTTHKDRLEEVERQRQEAADQQNQAMEDLQNQMLQAQQQPWADDAFHGPLSPSQQAQMDAMAAAAAAAQAAQQAAQDANQAAQDQAGQAAQALQTPINKAMNETKQQLDEEESKFAAWGIGPGQLERMSFEERQALATKLGDSKMDSYIDLMGRFRMMASAQRVHRVEYGRDQVVGVELSGDLTRTVMAEFANLAMGDDEVGEMLELDFYRRWTEEQLLSRKYVGEEKVGKGAIICCVDNSGSMTLEDGDGIRREAWAKSMALALLDTALRQKRSFVGINFSSSTQVQVFEFPRGRDADLGKVMAFIEQFFNGGTDFAAPMDAAIKVLESEYNDDHREKGDIVFITDDDCAVTPDWLRSYTKRKERLGFRTFGIGVGVPSVGGALVAMSDSVRVVQEFADPSGVRDIFQVI